jgi:hypothetical protein
LIPCFYCSITRPAFGRVFLCLVGSDRGGCSICVSVVGCARIVACQTTHTQLCPFFFPYIRHISSQNKSLA